MTMLANHHGRRTLAHLVADMHDGISCSAGGVLTVDGAGTYVLRADPYDAAGIVIHPSSRMDDGTYRTAKNLGWRVDGTARAIGALLLTFRR